MLAENSAEKLKAKLNIVRTIPEKIRVKKMENFEKKSEKIDGMMESLVITVPNERYQKHNANQTGTIRKAKKKDKFEKIPLQNTNTKGEMLQKLKILRQGKITSEKMLKSQPLRLRSKKSIKRQDDIERNKAEVMRLNHEIQLKITQKIKPQLQSFMNCNHEKPCNNEPSSSLRQEFSNRTPRTSTKEVPIRRTTVNLQSNETVEIYRYTPEDFYNLENRSTLQMVPRLMSLNICRTKFNPLDTFLLKMLPIKNPDDRLDAILEEAENRHLIKRIGFAEYEYINSLQEPIESTVTIEAEKTPRKKTIVDHKKVPSTQTFEHLRLLAKNDEELNELIYQHEFIDLFENVLKDQDIKNGTPEVMIKHLIEENLAHIIEGEIRVNSRNLQEAYVSHPKATKDVCIQNLILRKHAHHGDLVRVLVMKNSEDYIALPEAKDIDIDVSLHSEVNPINRNFGCVLDILEKRHSRRVIGTLAPIDNIKKNRKHLMFISRDPKVPDVRINAYDGIPKDVEISDQLLMVVLITSWSHDQPQGKIVDIIGKKGQLPTENAAILLQNNLHPLPYSQEILDQLPAIPFEIPAKEFDYREDLRKKCIFSIDPETARDLDDALSCEVLENGNLEIGVHISDVSFFLAENSDLDFLVKEKATTIYLVDTVYHMLPVPLCMLCSLLPGADKIAYSVFWEMTETGDILNKRFTRSIINSCAKLNYDHAQMVIENKHLKELEDEFPVIHNGFKVTDISNAILKLQSLAVILRNKRKTNGALKIDQPKISFTFEKNDQRMESPVDFFKYPIKDSNKLIEEFMLLANISVAEFIYSKFPEVSLLRSHFPPNENGIQKLVKSLQKFAIYIDVTSSKALSESMERVISHAKAPEGMNAVMNALVSKTMTRARYYCSDIAKEPEDFWHYALSIPMYTHFTSPIRRYPDILVHR